MRIPLTPTTDANIRTRLLVVALLLGGLPPLSAEPPRFSEARLHGRSAYVLENDLMRVAALRGAGHLAEIRLKSSDPLISINPMRVPHFPTIEPWEYDSEKHDRVYGSDTSRILQSGYMGHLLNFPRFGGPSSFEAENGLGNHGEALAVEWQLGQIKQTADGVVVDYSAELPKSQYNVGRTLTLAADETVLYIEEWVESLTDFDRPAHWVQHVTFGPPFVEPGRTTLDMSATQGKVPEGRTSNSLKGGDVRWPHGTSFDGQPASLRPMQSRPKAGTYAGYLMDPTRKFSFFTMYHPNYKVLIGYVWRTKDFPWMGDWQENGSNEGLPWGGKVQARGMEFGTTPFGGPMEKVVEDGPLFGTPTYRWIGGRQRVTVRYIAFLAPNRIDFSGVTNVTVSRNRITVQDRSGNMISLKSEKSWQR